MHGFEDADMVKGQGEWRVMARVGCRCPQWGREALLAALRLVVSRGSVRLNKHDNCTRKPQKRDFPAESLIDYRYAVGENIRFLPVDYAK